MHPHVHANARVLVDFGDGDESQDVLRRHYLLLDQFEELVPAEVQDEETADYEAQHHGEYHCVDLGQNQLDRFDYYRRQLAVVGLHQLPGGH